MRVIAGEFRARKLTAPAGLETRPTPDRMRETLFNVLRPRLAGSTFLDVYAGTGAVGIEALSQGARRSMFIESGRAAVEAIRANLASLGLESRAEVCKGQAATLLERLAADIVFLDPPYELEREYATAMSVLAEGESALAVVQHASGFAVEPAYGRLRRYRVLKQGGNSLSFYE